jgi:large subunit ribosomal protein L15
MPLQQRVPKFGFSSRTNNLLKDVNVKLLEGMSEVSLQTLKEKKIISKKIEKVKIFGNTELSSKVEVVGIKVTKGAKESIEKAGGSIKE